VASVSLKGVAQLLNFQNTIEIVLRILLGQRKQVVFQIFVSVGLKLTEEDYVLIVIE
jgi:hypothetical protein